MEVPEDKFQTRQQIMQAERMMIDCGSKDRIVLLTPILLDIRELLQTLVDSQILNSASRSEE